MLAPVLRVAILADRSDDPAAPASSRDGIEANSLRRAARHRGGERDHAAPPVALEIIPRK
jgi:hypothetical protein